MNRSAEEMKALAAREAPATGRWQSSILPDRRRLLKLAPRARRPAYVKCAIVVARGFVYIKRACTDLTAAPMRSGVPICGWRGPELRQQNIN